MDTRLLQTPTIFKMPRLDAYREAPEVVDSDGFKSRVSSQSLTVPPLSEPPLREAFSGCLGTDTTGSFGATSSRESLSPTGRQRRFVAFGCSCSALILCRSMVATGERPRSPSLALSAA